MDLPLNSQSLGIYTSAHTPQKLESDLQALRDYCAAHGLTVVREYSDTFKPRAKSGQPALRTLLRDARTGVVSTIAVANLAAFRKGLRSLVLLLDELHAAGVRVVSAEDGLDLTPADMSPHRQLVAVLAGTERREYSERVKLSLVRARAKGRRIGRPLLAISDQQIAAVAHLSLRQAAERLGVSRSYVARRRRLASAA